MTKIKKKHRLFYQVIAVIVLFYTLATIIGLYSMYKSSTKTYLTAKNDMIERDLAHIRDELFSAEFFPEYPWYFEYCRDHRQELLEASDYPANDTIWDEYDQLFNYSQDNTDKLCSKIKDASAEFQLYLAQINTARIKSDMMQQMNTYQYEDLYLFSICDDQSCFNICRGILITDDNCSETASCDFGTILNYSPKKHPAIKAIMNGSTHVQFENFVNSDSKSETRYIGCLPVTYNGKPLAVLCVEFNYASFRKDLIKEVVVRGAVLFAGIILCCAIVILLINFIVVKPTAALQKAVNNYKDTRDSSAAAKEIDRISIHNEIGSLSSDFKDMMLEIDDYISEYKTLSVEVMEALAHTIDAKDKYTNGHSSRVAIYSRMLGKKLGLSLEDQERLYNMGLLHDIGKIGIPSSIINKTTRLDDDEYAVIKTHPMVGYGILSEIKSRPDLSVGARWHHERFDGKGYPDGLAGEDIPFEARIIAVADCYDAMTSSRSYRSYLPQDIVRGEIEKNMGTQFDPVPAKAMLEIIDNDKNYMLHE